jgi:hypothetical protein
MTAFELISGFALARRCSSAPITSVATWRTRSLSTPAVIGFRTPP